MTDLLEIPAFLRRARRADTPSLVNGRSPKWLPGVPKKAPFKKHVSALIRLGWTKTQAQAVSRKDAQIAVELKSPPNARFMTDLWKDGGDGKPE